MKIADSLRLCAPTIKETAGRLRLYGLFVYATDYWVVQQAAVGGSLHDPEGAHKSAPAYFSDIHKIVMQMLKGSCTVHAYFSHLHTIVMHFF